MAARCVFLAALLALAAAADSGHVLVLSEANFSSTVSTPDQITLVEFFAPWCGHCKNLAPEYAKAAESLASSTPRVRLATVDATVERGLAEAHDVSGYPTLKVFRDGKSYEYEGPREASGIADYMRAQADPAWKPPVDAVIDLNEENFDEVIAGKLVLVEFYAPWCGHCKALAPKYERAARELAKLPEPIVLAKLDATKHQAIAQRFSVQGYPTLKVFRNSIESDYQGGRESHEIVQEMTELSRPAAQLVEDAVDLHMRTKKANSLLAVAFLAELGSPESLVLQEAAQDLRKEVKVLYTAHAGARQQYAVPPGTLVLVQPSRFQSRLELPRATMSLAGASAESIVSFVRSNKYPLVGHRTSASDLESPGAHRYDERPLVAVFFDVQYNADLQTETNYWREQVLKVATKHRQRANKDLFFAIGDETEFRGELTDLGISATDDREVHVAILGKDDRYVMQEEFDVDSLGDFVEDFLAGKLKPYIKSQKPSKKTEGGVTVVVGSNFNKIVMDPTKDVLLEIYAPWCGHCKALTPKYSQLAKKLKGVRELVIAKIDATANDVPAAFRPKGFPTIVLVKKGSNEVVPYEGDREVSAFVDFLRANTAAAIPKDEL